MLRASQIQQYLNRLKISALASADSLGLKQLQHAHLQTVPFENLSIHWGEPMELSIPGFFQKVVADRRGGVCYECNGLFASLLRGLGYDTTLLSAQVARSDGTYTPEFDHMLLLVSLGEPWLVDVGFGDSFRTPLRFAVGATQFETGRAYRIERSDGFYVLHQKLREEDWCPQFRFTLKPRTLADFQEMFYFHRDSADSHFRRAPLATIATSDGRKTLSGFKFIRSSLDGQRSEQEIPEHDYSGILNREFDIVRSRT
ncbi:arylamine N-acetyltransferase family protein [Gilvimarinus sp. F26214L]|uniref:arylamine N-acetyltransferase family protein n=1 Tax=Gilvimarinus sp. DZF01 TaxID=3461371 RepID=UPI0040462A72